jgi:S1-C subfamily serine protease
VPSNTILRELPSLVANGAYNSHSYLGIHVVSVDYNLAQEQNLKVTYGLWIPTGQTEEVIAPDGPSAGKILEGDVIIALNGSRIRHNDDLASYLIEKTLPSDVLVVALIRDNEETTVNVTLGTRPPPNV